MYIIISEKENICSYAAQILYYTKTYKLGVRKYAKMIKQECLEGI